jgi:rhodanese-related sulfurtransferase
MGRTDDSDSAGSAQGETRGGAPFSCPFALTLSARADQNTNMSVPRISKEDLKQRLESSEETKPVLLDARLKYPFEHSTIKLPGAIRVSPADVQTTQLPRDRDLVAYDSDPDEISSSRVAGALIQQGYRVSALKGGIAEWVAANFPTEQKDAPRQAPPQPGALKE